MINKKFITVSLILSLSLTLTHKTHGLLFKHMNKASGEEFIALAQAEYLQQLQTAGIQADAQVVAHEFNILLPQGYATVNNYFYDVLDITSGKYIAKVWWYNKPSKNHTSLSNSEIAFLWVVPEFRGKGWGKQVLTKLETLYFKDKVHAIKLHVFRHNTAAIKLYERVGYAISLVTDYGYFMEKHLNNSN